jgi:hypothetical protein
LICINAATPPQRQFAPQARNSLAESKMSFDPAPQVRGTHERGDYVTWAMVTLLGMLGPVIAHGARDDEMYLFGLSLFGFCATFLFFEVKRHYDMIDTARAIAAVPVAGE